MLREFSSEHREELKAAVGKTPADQAKADAMLALLGDATFWSRLRLVSTSNMAKVVSQAAMLGAFVSALPAPHAPC